MLTNVSFGGAPPGEPPLRVIAFTSDVFDSTTAETSAASGIVRYSKKGIFQQGKGRKGEKKGGGLTKKKVKLTSLFFER